jgi:hypothetical protein
MVGVATWAGVAAVELLCLAQPIPSANERAAIEKSRTKFREFEKTLK